MVEIAYHDDHADEIAQAWIDGDSAKLEELWDKYFDLVNEE